MNAVKDFFHVTFTMILMIVLIWLGVFWFSDGLMATIVIINLSWAFALVWLYELWKAGRERRKQKEKEEQIRIDDERMVKFAQIMKGEIK